MPKTPKNLPSQEQRTLQMKQQYIQLRKDGLSIRRIAGKFDLPTQAVIDCHREIYGDLPVSSSAPQATVPSDTQSPTTRHQAINGCINSLYAVIGQSFNYLNSSQQQLAVFQKEVSSWQ